MKITVKNVEGLRVCFEKRFEAVAGVDFGAYNAAIAFLRSIGVDHGSMQRGAPIGLCRNADISKWRNLSREDVSNLEGVLLPDGGGSFRGGGATVYLTFVPDETSQSVSA